MQKIGQKICVVGLGYVGLPLAIALSKKFDLVGFDISADRILELKNGTDNTNEIQSEELLSCDISFTNNVKDISDANFYIVTVPTPVDSDKKPDISMLVSASEIISKNLVKGDIVVYESTVYPGATEEICIPILETNSKLKFNKDFYVGYSPERINPGDKQRTIDKIVKVVSASNDKALKIINSVYSSIIDAGTYPVDSIKVAEAAKVIENTQRDINIALINEFAKIFNLLDIDTEEVLKAAETKWNFIPFRPGLVGGHCIGVDPYYLTYKSEALGYKPEMILSGRELNDGMASYIADQISELMLKKQINIKGSDILIFGYSFKENCNDVRNTKIKDLFNYLLALGANVSIFDPHVNNTGADLENINFIDIPEEGCERFDAIILSVNHKEFKDLGINKIRSYLKVKSFIYDLKYIFSKELTDYRL